MPALWLFFCCEAREDKSESFIVSVLVQKSNRILAKSKSFSNCNSSRKTKNKDRRQDKEEVFWADVEQREGCQVRRRLENQVGMRKN